MCATEEMEPGVAAGVSEAIVEISAVQTPGQSRAMSSSNGYATNDSQIGVTCQSLCYLYENPG